MIIIYGNIELFQPSGIIPQLDYARLASKKGSTLVSIKCSDGLILLIKRKKNSNIIINNNNRNMNIINDNICIGYSGLFFDANVLTRVAKQITIDHKNNFNEDIRLLYLIDRISMLFHSLTIKSKSRPLGLELLLLGYDHQYGYQIYTINPDGSYYSWNAIAIGGIDNEKVTQNLIKYIKSNNSQQNIINNLLLKNIKCDIFGLGIDDNDWEIDIFTGSINNNVNTNNKKMIWKSKQ
jgi:20S proteasome alpha/beta subunit